MFVDLLARAVLKVLYPHAVTGQVGCGEYFNGYICNSKVHTRHEPHIAHGISGPVAAQIGACFEEINFGIPLKALPEELQRRIANRLGFDSLEGMEEELMGILSEILAL